MLKGQVDKSSHALLTAQRGSTVKGRGEENDEFEKQVQISWFENRVHKGSFEHHAFL